MVLALDFVNIVDHLVCYEYVESRLVKFATCAISVDGSVQKCTRARHHVTVATNFLLHVA